MANLELLVIEVAYALPDSQKVILLTVVSGATIAEAIQLSGILTIFPEIDLAKQRVGVFGKLKKLTDLVEAGDRIEIYRPLVIEPKEARRLRVMQKKNAGSRNSR
ncbi:MAG: RnfH family protein [Gammaproteobacteria bacterium RIFCSPHIGHO2_12_FULL_41_20]|nr:MAG: RnfH family protein [Gammaproteobacteria bacterium RIFCSPHIGHO2_12_FULL_41_20]